MGREIKRVAADFNWPLEKVWRGYINPFYVHSHQCPDCKNGYGEVASRYHNEWYGQIDFDPVVYGSPLMAEDNPVLLAWVRAKVDRSIQEFNDKGTRCYYTDNGRIDRDTAVFIEVNRLLGFYVW